MCPLETLPQPATGMVFFKILCSDLGDFTSVYCISPLQAAMLSLVLRDQLHIYPETPQIYPTVPYMVTDRDAQGMGVVT